MGERADNLKYRRWVIEAKESANARAERKRQRKRNRAERPKIGHPFKRPPLERAR